MTLGQTGHNCGGSKRMLDEEAIRSSIAHWEAQPISANRSDALKKLRRQLRNIADRSTRNG